MTSSEFDWITANVEAADSTESTQDHSDEQESTESTQDHGDEDSTESTADGEIRMNADHTDDTSSDEFPPRNLSKLPQSQIVTHDIAVNMAASVSLPADSNAAFAQWLAGSQLSPGN